MTALHFQSIDQISAQLRDGAVTAVALARAGLDRIEALEPTLNAFISVSADLALEQATEADAEIKAGRWRGPLHGVPVAVKDLLVTAGLRTTFASRAYADTVTDYDATVVARLKAAGAVLVGKTNLSEGAADSSCQSSAFGGPCNPWSPDRITGGSSGGSAAAVAAGMAYAALGSDTAMSIRQPAALCGVVGLKPTYGRVSKHGAMSLAFSLDHIGPLTRTVRDAAILMQALAGHDSEDPTSADRAVPDFQECLSRDIRGARIAVLPGRSRTQANPEWAAATEKAATLLESQGAVVREADLPNLTDLYFTASTILAVEAAAFHAHAFRKDPGLFGDVLRGLIEYGQGISGVDYVQAQRIRRLAGEEFMAGFSGYDALLLPTTPEPACLIADDDHQRAGGRRMRNTLPFNALGLPAISVPAGTDFRGMPIGVQLVGRPFEEPRLLGLAAAYETTLGLAEFHPPI